MKLPTKPTPPRVLAALLGVSAGTIGRQARRGQIPAVFTAGGHARILPCAFERVVDEPPAQSTGRKRR